VNTARRLARDGRFVLAGTYLALICLVAVFGSLIVPYPADLVNPSQQLRPPGAGHLLGTDEFGRDILTRVMLGARLTILVSLSSVAIAVAGGTLLGVTAGYLGGIVEMVAMRLVDAILSFHPFLLAIFVVTFLGPKVENLIVTIGILYIPQYARITHVVTLAAKQQEYVQAAQAIGARTARILTRAILPNVLAPLTVQLSLGLGSAVLIESGLSFLGLGPPPPTPSWGRSIEQSARFMNVNAHAVIWPSVAVSLTILTLNLLGDALRDNLDPRLRKL
jgi:peptide/nickel transport system permease protein